MSRQTPENTFVKYPLQYIFKVHLTPKHELFFRCDPPTLLIELYCPPEENSPNIGEMIYQSLQLAYKGNSDAVCILNLHSHSHPDLLLF